jgi:hypothetical protein
MEKQETCQFPIGGKRQVFQYDNDWDHEIWGAASLNF